ncbi:rod shape-determining protein RodA [bacterium]|nr:rod shape-determining protein RodA [bacterium]
MKDEERGLLKNINWITVVLTVIISIAGIANLYSLQVNTHESAWISQLSWFVISIFVLFIITSIDYRIFSEIAMPLYIINIILLVLVLFFGTTVNGSTRWIDLGFFRYQPSESMKLVLALVLARYFAMYQGTPLGFKQLIPPFILTLIPAILIKIQPDLGSAAILFFELFIILFMVKIRAYVWLLSILFVIIFIPVMWFFVLNEYHIERIKAFWNPEKYAQTTAYQTLQSQFAIGSGGMNGKGYTKGPVSKGGFVPEQKTDFAFSVWAEEQGFKGSIALILIYFILIFTLIHSTSYSTDHFGVLLSLSIIAYIVSQVVLNLLMVTGLFPVIGVPLPLFSYGGTNMLITMTSIGMIMSLYARRFFFSYLK